MGKKAVLFLLVAVLVEWGFKQTEATASVAGPQKFNVFLVEFNNGYPNNITSEEANWVVFNPGNSGSCQNRMLADSGGLAWLEGGIYPDKVIINSNPGSLEDPIRMAEALDEALKVILPLLPEPRPNIIIMASGGPKTVFFGGKIYLSDDSSLGVAWIGTRPGAGLSPLLNVILHEIYHTFGALHCRKFPENNCYHCDLTDPACISLVSVFDVSTVENCVMGYPSSDELCSTHRSILFGSSRSITVTDTAGLLIEPRYSGGVTLVRFSPYEIEYSGGKLFLRFILPPDTASANAIDAVRIKALNPGEFCVFPDGSSVEFLGETPPPHSIAQVRFTVSPVATTTTTTMISATTTTATATTTTLPCQCVADSGCISGRVINGAGKTVMLKKKGSKMIATAIAGTDGCYKFTGLQDGTYKVKVRKCKGGGAKTVNIANGGKVESLNFNCR